MTERKTHSWANRSQTSTPWSVNFLRTFAMLIAWLLSSAVSPFQPPVGMTSKSKRQRPVGVAAPRRLARSRSLSHRKKLTGRLEHASGRDNVGHARGELRAVESDAAAGLGVPPLRRAGGSHRLVDLGLGLRRSSARACEDECARQRPKNSRGEPLCGRAGAL